ASSNRTTSIKTFGEAGQNNGVLMPRCSKIALALIPALVPFVAAPSSAQKSNALQLIELAKSPGPALRDAINATFDAKDLQEGTAWSGHGPDFFFATHAATRPQLFIDTNPGTEMRALSGTDLWFAAARIEATGKLHSFHYVVNGAKFGGKLDMPAFTPLSYQQPGVPSGRLSEEITHISKIYDGMKSEYWIYIPAQYNPDKPAAVMIFNDGGWYMDRNGNNPVLNVIDNLIAQKKIPVMICIFINPGDITDSPGTPTYDFVKAYSEKWNRTLK